jgi:hypothetical protein
MTHKVDAENGENDAVNGVCQLSSVAECELHHTAPLLVVTEVPGAKVLGPVEAAIDGTPHLVRLGVHINI